MATTYHINITSSTIGALIVGPRGTASGHVAFDSSMTTEQAIRATTGAQAAPFYVPFFRNPDFVGREEHLNILAELLDVEPTRTRLPVALTGMGGIGKTQLAIEHAYACRSRYTDGVFWISAAESDWRRSISALCTEIGLDGGSDTRSTSLDRASRSLTAYLRARPNALLILDNVGDPLDVLAEGSAPGFVPAHLGCRVLFTTRVRRPEAQITSLAQLPQLDQGRSMISDTYGHVSALHGDARWDFHALG